MKNKGYARIVAVILITQRCFRNAVSVAKNLCISRWCDSALSLWQDDLFPDHLSQQDIFCAPFHIQLLSFLFRHIFMRNGLQPFPEALRNPLQKV